MIDSLPCPKCGEQMNLYYQAPGWLAICEPCGIEMDLWSEG